MDKKCPEYGENIERKKIALVMIAERYGRTDPRVLAASRELDRLIVELQRGRRRCGRRWRNYHYQNTSRFT
jgi:hypothetical protein